MCDIDCAMKKPEAGPALEAAARGLSLTRKEAGSLGRGNEVKVKRPPPNAVSPYRDGCRIGSRSTYQVTHISSGQSSHSPCGRITNDVNFISGLKNEKK